MKRSLLAIAASLALGSGLFAQTQFDTFAGALGTFSTSMASALALNASVGSTWSDAYVGGFPRFGVGAVVGSAFTGKGSVDPLFSALGQTAPAYFSQLGVPIPAVGLSAKIGLPFLPIDVGVSGGYLPQELGDKLRSAANVSLDYKNIAGQVRVALLKENILFPDISLGVGLSYQEGSVSTPIGAGTTTLVNNQSINGHTWNVSATDPDLSLGWKATNVDGTLQISKSLLILRPYAGLGYTMGSSEVSGGVNSSIVYTRDGSGSNYSTLASDITYAGGTPPTFTAAGYTYTSKASDPMFRLYGGLSFEILVLKFDTQVMYVPATKNLGATFMTRLQL